MTVPFWNSLPASLRYGTPNPRATPGATYSPSAANQLRRTRLAWFSLFAAELLLVGFLQRSLLLSFNFYFFEDQGTNLVAQYLTHAGLRPALDFGYSWGLLGLLFGRVWFTIFGTTPIACETGLLVTSGLGVAWAIARIATDLKLNPPSIAIVLFTLPFAARAMPPSFAHGLEAAFIANAIAYQLEGRKPVALALTTAALFARPAMAYFYGAWLIFLMAWDRYRSGVFSVGDLKALKPAASTGLCLLVLLGATYGPASLGTTLLPTHGMANYRASHYGFLNQGASFLYSRSAGPFWYIGSPAGIWIVASFWLLVRGGRFVPALVAGRSTPRQEVTLTCGLLHIVFVFLMFGNTWTWTYYFFILIIGTIAAASPTPVTGFRRVYVHALAVFSMLFFLTYIHQLNRRYSQDPETRLWWPSDESNEWAQVVKLLKGKRSALMVEAGGGALISLIFQKPVAMYLLPAFEAGNEPERESDQLRNSDAIVTTVFHPTSLGSCLNYYPKLREAIGNASITFQGKYFVVYEHPNWSVR